MVSVVVSGEDLVVDISDDEDAGTVKSAEVVAGKVVEHGFVVEIDDCILVLRILLGEFMEVRQEVCSQILGYSACHAHHDLLVFEVTHIGLVCYMRSVIPDRKILESGLVDGTINEYLRELGVLLREE